MSRPREDELGTRLQAGAPGVELAPDAAARGARAGTRRLARRRTTLAAAAVVAVAVAVAVLAVPDLWGKADGPEIVTSDDAPADADAARPAPLLLTRDRDTPPNSLMAALNGGRLVVTRDNCIAVGEDPDHWMGVVWGYGWTARWEGEEAVVVDRQGNVFAREGDPITLGGGGLVPSAERTGSPCWSKDMWSASD